MSVSKEIYVGCYLKIWLPKRKGVQEGGGVCRSCNIEVDGEFCSRCGGKLSPKEIYWKRSIYDLCKTYLGKKDYCYNIEPQIHNQEYDYILLNKINFSGKNLDDWGEFDVPKENWKPWDLVIKMLDDEEIKYEKKYGVFIYYQ